MKDIKPSADGKGQKVKVKARVNIHGIFTISSASLIESKENSEVETMDEDKVENEPNGVEQQQSSTPSQQQQQQEKPPNAEANSTAPEVGSSWTKKISAWFGRVRSIRPWPMPGKYHNLPQLLFLFCCWFHLHFYFRLTRSSFLFAISII